MKKVRYLYNKFWQSKLDSTLVLWTSIVIVINVSLCAIWICNLFRAGITFNITIIVKEYNCGVLKLSMIVGIIFSMIKEIIYNILYVRVDGTYFNIGRFNSEISIRGVRIDKKVESEGLDIKSINSNLKAEFKNEIKKVCNYIKRKEIRHFKVKTHSTFYIMIMEGFGYIKEGVNHKNLINEICKEVSEKGKCVKKYNCGDVTFEIHKLNREIIERSFVFSYKRLLMSTDKEWTDIVQYKNSYIVTFDIK